MKQIFRATPILLTLLLLGLGAFMPRLAAMVLDQRLEADVTHLKNEDFSFTLEQEVDFFQTLELFSNGHTQVGLSEGYRMKIGDAVEAAVEAKMHLSVFDGKSEIPEVTPMLIASRSTPGLSGIFWRCVWHKSANVQEVLWLDDQSGKMVFFAGRVEQSTSTISAFATIFPQAAVNAAEYCRLYYPVDTVKLALAQENDPYERYVVTLLKTQGEQEKSYTISILLVDGWLYFN